MKPSQRKTYLAGVLQGKAYRALSIHLTSVVAAFSLSVPEWKLLGQLVEHGDMKLARLAQLLGVEAPLVTSLVDTLEKKKLVKRTSDQQDKRAKVLHATKKGYKIIEDMEPKVRNEMRLLLRGATKEEVEGYMKVLALIVKNSSSS